ncbi:hypothetical protein [Zobellella sp. DQSA1]|uniref:hypothetical protein n=1 Tax=Zobellella sp. DQSA1 TaxID=3342386 RepID=UPI0035BF78DF
MGRSDLKGITGEIVGSFISRNNEVDGYWALGLLCRLSRELNQTKITMDLVSPGLKEKEEAGGNRHLGMLPEQQGTDDPETQQADTER